MVWSGDPYIMSRIAYLDPETEHQEPEQTKATEKPASTLRPGQKPGIFPTWGEFFLCFGLLIVCGLVLFAIGCIIAFLLGAF